MKGIGKSLLGLSVLLLCLTARADRPVFGNSPGFGNAFSLAFAAGNTFGGAVLFTPSQDICLSSVTLWLNSYTGQNGVIPSVSIYTSQQMGPGNYQLAALIATLGTPAPNDGSTAPFIFTDASAQTILEANTPYWLFAYGQWDGTSNYGSAACYWETGNSPAGGAAYNQANYYVNGGFSGQSAVPPAFEINAVPEPGTLTLLGFSLVFGIGRQLSHRRQRQR
ncbi:MAG TPA: choice-of-anchor R domain-containing protein [Pseudomonadales bacterium]|nr:choice-of-anchor R domain-containing protein [Pseudomonadales bacterium]